MSKKLRTFALRNNSNLDSIGYQVMKSKTNKKNIMKKTSLWTSCASKAGQQRK